MKIVVLENIDMTDDQRNRLEKLGEVEWHDKSDLQECSQRIKNVDVVVLDWIDPSPFILSMKTPSLISLMSTGFHWIEKREEARSQNILISNVPNYATEAVAEHIFGLILNVARQTSVGDRSIRAGNTAKGYLEGRELKDRIIGIIGLGRIGSKVASLSKSFGMDVITYNRNPKGKEDIKDVPLDNLLKTSHIISVCCPLNDESLDLINKENLIKVREDAIIVGTTWDVINFEALFEHLKRKKLFGAGFDVAVEASEIKIPYDIPDDMNLVLTPHIGYNTEEAKLRQVDICISNIEAFVNGSSQNIVN